MEELHFTILNYILEYILFSKFFKCILCILNYDTCYILYLNVKFTINLDRNVWHHVKRPNCHSSQSLKNKEKIIFYYPKLYSWLHFEP